MVATPKEIGKRLQSMHKALEITQADVCRATGMKPNRYSQYFNGERRLTMDAAIAIADHYPVTMDWLIRGNVETLPMALHRKITHAA
jgi:transcriptional regulator with XRE-family HTH domain